MQFILLNGVHEQQIDLCDAKMLIEERPALQASSGDSIAFPGATEDVRPWLLERLDLWSIGKMNGTAVKRSPELQYGNVSANNIQRDDD